jgi:hypothetical protein
MGLTHLQQGLDANWSNPKGLKNFVGRDCSNSFTLKFGSKLKGEIVVDCADAQITRIRSYIESTEAPLVDTAN